MESLQLFLHQGGIAAWMILIAAIVLVIIGGERLFYLFFVVSFRSTKALEEIRDAVMKRNYTQAIQICSRTSGAPELRVIHQGLLAVENGREAMKSSIGGTLVEILHQLESRIGYVALIASSSTLLGLLGTIMGLIKTFAAIAAADPSMKAKLLGEGIAEAMYSTACGLVVGLAALVVHTMCVSKVDQIFGKSQDAGFKLVTWIEQSERNQRNG